MEENCWSPEVLLLLSTKDDALDDSEGKSSIQSDVDRVGNGRDKVCVAILIRFVNGDILNISFL